MRFDVVVIGGGTAGITAALAARSTGAVVASVVAQQKRVVERVAHDERDERFEQAGVRVLHGRARFVGPHELAVDGERLRAERFVIATGSEPAVRRSKGCRRRRT